MVANATRARGEVAAMMNPMSYLGGGHAAKPSENWRIRVGTAECDTSLAISAIVALRLENMGKQVDYALPLDEAREPIKVLKKQQGYLKMFSGSLVFR